MPEASPAKSICVRKREKEGMANFNYEKRLVLGGERIQEMRKISAREYVQMIKNRDQDAIPLIKTRTIFGYKDSHFWIETYKNLPNSFSILKVDTDHENPELPPFIKILEDVSRNPTYSSANLAKNQFTEKEELTSSDEEEIEK